MTATAQDPLRSDFEPHLTGESFRRHWVLIVAIVISALMVAGLVGLARWWWTGGTYLSASGMGVGAPAPVGVPVSVGIELTTSGLSSVELDRVSLRDVSGVQIAWSVYRAGPHQDGFGAWRGPLAPTYRTVGMHGLRVDQAGSRPYDGGTFLVMTATGLRPGVYHISGMSVVYRSGPRLRSTRANTDLCLLVYPPADQARIYRELDSYMTSVSPSNTGLDPLVAQYEACEQPPSP